MKPVKKIALLHDLCGIGKAAMTNMIPVLSVMGVEACPIPTMLLSSHTGGYGEPAIEKVSTSYIQSCARHYKLEDVKFDMIFVGYLGTTAMTDAVKDFILTFPEARVVLDPIMGDNGTYYKNFGNEYAAAVRTLIPYSHFVVPNLTEYFLLMKTAYETPAEISQIKKYCTNLRELGAKNIIITSVPSEKCQKGIAIMDENGQFAYQTNQELLTDYHGTGDVFDAVFTSCILQGCTMEESAMKAHHFVCNCIEESSKFEYAKREGLMIEKSLKMLYK